MPSSLQLDHFLAVAFRRRAVDILTADGDDRQFVRVAAPQAMQALAGALAERIPQRAVDAGDGADECAAVEPDAMGGREHRFPAGFDIAGVAADHQRRENFDQQLSRRRKNMRLPFPVDRFANHTVARAHAGDQRVLVGDAIDAAAKIPRQGNLHHRHVDGLDGGIGAGGVEHVCSLRSSLSILCLTAGDC